MLSLGHIGNAFPKLYIYQHYVWPKQLLKGHENAPTAAPLPLTGSPSLWHSKDIGNFDISPSFSLTLPQFLLYLSSLSSMNALHSTPLSHMLFLLTLTVLLSLLQHIADPTKMWLWALLQTEALWLHSPHCSYQDHHYHHRQFRGKIWTSQDLLLTPPLCFLQSPHPEEWADGENKDTSSG